MQQTQAKGAMGGATAKMFRRTANGGVRPRVILHTAEPTHGLAQYVSELVLALAKSGVPVVLFCPANFEYEAKVRAAGVEIVHAAYRETSDAGLAERLRRNFVFVARTALRQFRLVQRGDIVHFQSVLHLPLGFVFFFLVILRGGSLVLTAHDPLPHRWRFPRGLRWLERKMLEISYCLCDRIIVHNQSGKDVLVRQLRQEADRVLVIPHGPYSDAADNEVAYPGFDCLRLLAFGSIRENKGLHLAIRAVQMSASDSRIPVHLTITGRPYNADEQKYWHRCKELIAAKPDGIDTIERTIAAEELGPLLARHHAVLLPYTEFFSESGVAVLALSYRRPILATAAGGLAELMQRGACGIPIESPSSRAVADAISAAIDLGPEQLRQMGIAGNKFIRETRSWDSVARQTVQVYPQLAIGEPLPDGVPPMVSNVSPSRDAARDGEADHATSVAQEAS